MFPTGRTATVAWAEEELGCETKLCYFTTLGRLSTEPASEKPRRKVFVSSLDGGGKGKSRAVWAAQGKGSQGTGTTAPVQHLFDCLAKARTSLLPLAVSCGAEAALECVVRSFLPLLPPC